MLRACLWYLILNFRRFMEKSDFFRLKSTGWNTAEKFKNINSGPLSSLILMSPQTRHKILFNVCADRAWGHGPCRYSEKFKVDNSFWPRQLKSRKLQSGYTTTRTVSCCITVRTVVDVLKPALQSNPIIIDFLYWFRDLPQQKLVTALIFQPILSTLT